MAKCCTCTAGLVAVVSAGSLSVGETCGDNLGLPGTQGHGAVDAAGGHRTPPGALCPHWSRGLSPTAVRTQLWQIWGRKWVVLR